MESMAEKINRLKSETTKLETLLELYPDVQETTDRWETKRLSSLSVNSICNEVWFNHNCGCCNDSPLQAWPYILVEGEQIHSSPDCFAIGEANAWGMGDREWENWQEKLIKANISNIIIEKIKDYFIKYKAQDFEEEAEDD